MEAASTASNGAADTGGTVVAAVELEPGVVDTEAGEVVVTDWAALFSVNGCTFGVAAVEKE